MGCYPVRYSELPNGSNDFWTRGQNRAQKRLVNSFSFCQRTASDSRRGGPFCDLPAISYGRYAAQPERSVRERNIVGPSVHVRKGERPIQPRKEQQLSRTATAMDALDAILRAPAQ